MLSCCLKCRRNRKSKNPKIVKTKHGRIMLLSTCAMRDIKELKFIKERDASGLLSSLGRKTPLSEILLVGLKGIVLRVLSKLIQGIKWVK